MKILIEGPGRMEPHTRLSLLFDAIGDHLRKLRWLATDWELDRYDAPFAFELRHLPLVLEGRELAEFASRHDPQFVWGVLSGFPSDARIEASALQVIPSADGNPDVWNPNMGPQCPGAVMEIVCFDSGSTIVSTEDDSVQARLKAYFPEGRNLSEGPPS